MKSFFEFLGFVSTALISGFLVFSYIGHQKNAGKTDDRAFVTAHDTDESATLPDYQPISRSAAKEKKKAAKPAATEYATEKKTRAVETAAATERLKYLYEDEDFVRSAAKKWKNEVAEASEMHAVKPHLLLSNVIIQSYLGAYTARDFNRDVSEHAGDLALPTAAAVKSYDYAWSVTKVAQQYELNKYFPAPAPVAAAKAAPAYRTVTAPGKAAAAASKQSTKPLAAVSPIEAGFREMVAKEEGFASWQGLQRLGDLETKKNAERRVKMLMGTAKMR